MVLACDILPIDESVQALCHAGFAKAPNVLQDLVYSQGKSTSFCIDVRVRAFMMRVALDELRARGNLKGEDGRALGLHGIAELNDQTLKMGTMLLSANDE